MKKNLLVLLFISLVFIVGCTGTQKGAGIGSLVGAGAGAIIGHQSDHAAEGALIGAAVGAAGGALIGDSNMQRFCPECGQTFSSDVYYCPNDGTELKFVQS
ncbi:YMGG-like glycine zipper-containing protein [Candidatus Omnitrophota bacterium]